MTNENELKVGDVELDYILSKLDEGLHLPYPRIMNLIKAQQQRIELCESAIREFTNFVDPRDMLDSHACALNKLLELMEQAK